MLIFKNFKKIILFMLICFGLNAFLFAQTEMQISRTDGIFNQAYGFSVDLNGNTAAIGAYNDLNPNSGLVNGSVYFNHWNGSIWEQTQKIYFESSITELSEAGFGYKVAISDTVAMISAPWDFTGLTVTGAVYYYHFNGNQWVFRQKIIPSNQGGYDDFGIDLSFSNNLLIVGASGTDSVIDTSNPLQMNFGAAYIFRWNGTQWVEEQLLRASDGNCFDSFGDRVAIQGNTAVVTAFEAGPFNASDIHLTGPGKAYIYNYNDTEWEESQILMANDATNGDWFGRSVKLNNNSLFIGAWKDNNNSSISGSVYTFYKTGDTWVQGQKILPTANPNTSVFGSSIDIEADRLIVGSAFWGTANNGTVYVYDLENSLWVLNHMLNHTDPSESGDDFGYSVAMSGDKILVGAPWKNALSGSAYVYHYENLTPIANAGIDQVVSQGALVTLNASASFDPENAPISYLWTAPEGIDLNDNTSINPSFTAPNTTQAYLDLSFSLTCNDGNLNSIPDTVNIRVMNSNLMPIANAGDNDHILESGLYILDGSSSFDPEGQPITYEWSAPQGIILSANNISNPNFTCPQVTENTVFVFTLIVNDGQFDSEASTVEITVEPILEVQNLTYNAELTKFSWNPPTSVAKVFRYDDNTCVDALGAQNETSMLGLSFYENSIIEEITWFLTSDGGPHDSIRLLILGLNNDGSPNNSEVLYQNDNVPNEDDQWSTFTLPNAITALNGFFVGLNYNGFIGLGMDDGIGAPYNFINGTHWVSIDWINGPWENIEQYDFHQNFMLRASGLSMSAISDIAPLTHKIETKNKNFLYSIPSKNKLCQSKQDRSDLFLNCYNLYLDGVLIEENFPSINYTISNIANGTHSFGVTARYVNGIESDLAEIEFSYLASDTENIQLNNPYLNNYPNPFNPNTTICFNLKQDSQVDLSIFNLKGQKIAELVNTKLKSGDHRILWDGLAANKKTAASGMYFYRLKTNYDQRTGKMLLMK